MLARGEHLETLIKKQEKGIRVESLENVPWVYEDLEPVWRIFWCLHRSRGGNGFGPSPLMLSEIVCAFNFFRVAANEQEDYLDYIQALDGCFFEHIAKK